MTMMRWDPFRELANFEDRWHRLTPGGRGEETFGTWVPPVDIYEDGQNGLVLNVDLPGMKREDITVTVENDTVTVSGERQFSTEVKEEQVHRVERRYGRFQRSFSVPAKVDSGRVAAEYRDGTLTVRLPFREESKPKQIQITPAA